MICLWGLLISPVFALGEKPSEFVGDSFFGSPIIGEDGKFIPIENYEDLEQEKYNNPNKTIPPVKLLRLKLKAYHYKRQEAKEQKNDLSDDNIN